MKIILNRSLQDIFKYVWILNICTHVFHKQYVHVVCIEQCCDYFMTCSIIHTLLVMHVIILTYVFLVGALA